MVDKNPTPVIASVKIRESVLWRLIAGRRINLETNGIVSIGFSDMDFRLGFVMC